MGNAPLSAGQGQEEVLSRALQASGGRPGSGVVGTRHLVSTAGSLAACRRRQRRRLGGQLFNQLRCQPLLLRCAALQGSQHVSSLFAWQHVAGQQQAELVSLHGTDAASASSSSGSGGSDAGPLVSRVSCKRTPSDSGNITPKESDLQQQRRCAVQQAGSSPAGGYLAVCLVVKSE